MKTNEFIIAIKANGTTSFVAKDGIFTSYRNLSKIFQTYKSAVDYVTQELWYIQLKHISIYRY